MSALLLFFLLSFSLCSQVPVPQNVHMKTLNTDYSLVWTWPDFLDQNVSFSVRGISTNRFKPNRRTNWRTACENVSSLSCDLRALDLHYLGIYTLQVRASVLQFTSDWVPLDFAPAKDAAVGPPTHLRVHAPSETLEHELASEGGATLEVSLKAPQSNMNSSMKELIPSLYFRYVFWEKDHLPPHQFNFGVPLENVSLQNMPHQVLESTESVVMLQSLRPWTWFCVSAQSRTLEPNRSSIFTAPACAQTQGVPSWSQVALVFGLSLCGALLVVLGAVMGVFYCHRNLKDLLRPKETLPSFLQDLPVSPPLMTHQPEVHCGLLLQSNCSSGPLLQNTSSSQLQSSSSDLQNLLQDQNNSADLQNLLQDQNNSSDLQNLLQDQNSSSDLQDQNSSSGLLLQNTSSSGLQNSSSGVQNVVQQLQDVSCGRPRSSSEEDSGMETSSSHSSSSSQDVKSQKHVAECIQKTFKNIKMSSDLKERETRGAVFSE